MAAAAVAGVAAGAKFEMMPVALFGPFLVLLRRRPRREAIAAGVVMAAGVGLAAGVPLVRFGAGLMKRQGFLIALSVPESWRRLYQILIFGEMSPREFVRGGFLGSLFPSVILIALVLFLPRKAGPRPMLLAPLFFVVGALTFLSPGNAWVHALLPLAGCLAAGWLLRAALAWWWAEGGPAPLDPATLGVSLVMLPALLRQPFFLRNPIYGAFSAPLALVVAFGWLCRRPHARSAATALALGLAAAQAADRVREIGMADMTLTQLPGASVKLLPGESRFVTEAAKAIREVVPEGGSVGIFPEPGFLLFVTDRRNPFVDELFVPGMQNAAAEDLMIQRLRERPPDALLVTNRPYLEFGGAYYGSGVLDRFFREVSSRYVLARRIDAGPLTAQFTHGTHATKGLLLVPRETAARGRSQAP